MATAIPAWAQDTPKEEIPAWASAPAPAESAPAWATSPAPQQAMGNPDSNIRKFLNFLSAAEGASYNTIVGGGSFNDFTKHPRVVGLRTKEGPSTAAGAYQITSTTYDSVAPKLGITDFSQESQDKIAIELIRQKGALQDVAQGNWEAAINKLGGTWASLPSSPYSQPKKTMEWSLAKLNGTPTPPGYQPFAQVRKDIDPKSLNSDTDWLRASLLMYSLWERKPFEGSENDLAEWGKDFMGYFNYNMVDMARQAYSITQGATQEEKQAFLYMMDTYDNTNISWEGTGRAFKGILTDPTNLVGLSTLGIGFAGKFVGKQATKQGLKAALQQGLARTGIAAGVEGAVFAGTDSAIRQGVEVSAGRRESIDLSKIGADATIGAAAGVVLGTAADAAVTGIYRTIRGATPSPTAAPTRAAEFQPNVSGVVPNAEARAMPEATVRAGEAPTPEAAGRDPNLGSTLTPSEISEATARQQVGRLPEDNVVPNVAGRPDVNLDIPAMNTGLRSTPMKMEELTRLGDQVADQLRPLPNDDLTKALEQLRTGALPIEESRIVARGVQMYADELQIQKAELIKQINAKPDAPNVPELQARLADLEERLAPLQLADDAFGSIAGSILRQRQEGLPGVRGITPESIMAERGVTKAEADQIWADLVGKAQVDAEIQAVARKYDDMAAQAIEAGDYAEAARVTAQKWRELDARVEDIAPKSATIVDKLTELAISNVFSIKTVLVNLIPSGIKTLVIPSLKALFNNPMEKATRAEFVASYSAMRSSFSAALRAGMAGWKYEQALLTRDGTRLVEGELALTGKLGGAIRLFPRILNATDEFLSRINYDSFVAGRAAANATMEGAEKGLKGKALDDFIKKAADEAVVVSRGATKGDDLVQPIINKGINLGLTGEELFRYVEAEAVKNPDALKKGTDEEALNFVRDVLYKRNFSGEGSFSKAAQWYEEGMKKFPTLKLVIGQLFFRTPVRVFEEGIRLTPGIQFLAPNFMSDLAGKNGTLRQARAQAEAMSSLAVAGAVLSLYAQGRITGDGAYDDYRQQKLRRDGALPEPYTIKMSDGSTWSYKGFDPIATPVKIMINALDRMDKLRIREAQGEFVDKAAYKYPLAAITVATGSIAQAIRDASLVEGADNFIKFVENAFNPEESESAFLKALGDKMFLLVPNTLHKIARDNDPSIRDPQTFWQMVEEKLLRPVGQGVPGVKTPFSYDVVGNIRKMSDTGSLWNVFSTASVEERMKGMNQEQAYVLQELDRLTRVTGTTFRTPTKHRDLGEMDLRTVLASDGKRTLYDVWQQAYRSMEPEKVLAPVLASPLPDGTYQHKAAKVETVQQIISQMQDAAFYEMMGSEQQVVDRVISEEIKKAKAKAGLFDTPRPY